MDEKDMNQGAMGVADNAPLDGTRLLTDNDATMALSILQKYRSGKANLEQQLVEDERWYQLRHWEYMRRHTKADLYAPEPTSAWLFNAIAGKHADAMDNYPEPNVLPRESSDREDAKTLGEILPVILERGEFDSVYSDNWWEKLKHGTAVYGIFWDNSLNNGLGDVAVRMVDLLNIYWEPGIEDIQQSRNVFVVSMQDIDLVEASYPELQGKVKGDASQFNAKYRYDESIDLSGKVAVVDWYYKTSSGGKAVLHYAKIIGDKLVYASQNEPQMQDGGWYDHGEYPFVFDVLFPVKGTPCGYGYVQLCKDPQLYIDKLSANILEHSMAGSKLRYFATDDVNVNEEELKDWSRPIVHVGGKMAPEKLQQMVISPPSPVYMDVLRQKIDEMKETSANRDVSNGGSTGGATAAAAIAALQEAGNKLSRDMINGSYRSYTKVCYLCIELVRQFYDETRTFRITGQSGDYEFAEFNNANIRGQMTGVDAMGNPTYRVPVFDLKVKAQKRSPFAREAQNQRAMELYAAGFFAPDNAQAALICLDMMEFEGIDQVREKVAQGQTLMNLVQQLAAENAQMKAVLGMAPAPMGEAPAAEAPRAPAGDSVGAKALSDQSENPMTSYQQRMQANARASIDSDGGVMA